MDVDPTTKPTGAQRERFLNKIAEWKKSGFQTEDLEDLLDSDFNEFLRRRHQILKEQVRLEKEKLQLPDHDVPAPEKIDATQKGPELPEEQPTNIEDEEPQTSTPSEQLVEPEPVDAHDDGILLIGEPLAPEDEVEPEIDEEGIIEVGKPPKLLKSKVHRSRDKESLKMSKTTKVSDKPEKDDSSDDEIFEGEPSESEDELEDEELDELEEMGEEDELEDPEDKPDRKRPIRTSDEEPPEGSGARKAGAVIVVIIIILAFFYFVWVNPIIIDEEEKVSAAFEIVPDLVEYDAGSIIEFDASTSDGKDLNYNWILDDDFQVTEGSLTSKIMRGYYTYDAKDKDSILKSITLTVSGSDKEETVTKEITIKPISFRIADEKLGDSGEFQVDGYLDMSNPNGLASFSFKDSNAEYDVAVNSVNLIFNTKDPKPMTLDFEDGGNIQDGFQQSHSVYKRTLDQELDLGGHVSVIATVKSGFGGGTDYPIYPKIEGTMNTNDVSYADFSTNNIIYGRATNDLDLTIKIEILTTNRDYPFTSTDIIESYPDLRNNPENLRLVDLAVGELELGDVDSITNGNVIYSWSADKIDYIFEKPVMKVNITINSDSMDRYNLDDFFLNFWIAEDISQPVKTQLYSVHKNNGNTTTLNYISLMTDFTEGNSVISGRSCDSSTPDGHFYDRRPGYEYVPSSNWSYFPPTKDSATNGSTETSFDAFTHEQAMVLVQSDSDFANYKTEHPECYVVSGYCNASGDKDKGIPVGTLTWNLTFGYKNNNGNSIIGLNVLVSEDGDIYSEDVKIDSPPLAQEGFEPLLTFGGSEDIYSIYDGKEFHSIIFENDKIDLENVNYGVQTNLQYPNLEITSIMFIEHSKYSYTATYNQQIGGGNQRVVTVALDAETGQLLYYLDHTDNGFSLF